MYERLGSYSGLPPGGSEGLWCRIEAHQVSEDDEQTQDCGKQREAPCIESPMSPSQDAPYDVEGIPDHERVKRDGEQDVDCPRYERGS